MRGSGFVNALGFTTGTIFILLGVCLIVGGLFISSSIDSAIMETSEGLRTASEAIDTATDGVSSSTGMIEEVRLSMENTAGIVSSTGEVIKQTVTILEELRIILPAIANDMASLPSMVSSMMPTNHFEEVAERTETVSTELGFLNTQLESLSGDVTIAGEAIGEVAVSMESMEQDLLSAEGSFSNAAEKMEDIAAFLESSSLSMIVTVSLLGLGVFMLLAGLYQISAGMMIRKLVKGQVQK